jgi:hypothetical protein
LFQGLEGVLHGDDGQGLLPRGVASLIQGKVELPATPLAGAPDPRVIDEHLAHYLGGDREEVRPAAIVRMILPNQPHVGFVDQGRGLERVTGSLPAQVSSGQHPKFRVYQRNHLIQSRPITGCDCVEHHRDGLVLRHGNFSLSLA